MKSVYLYPVVQYLTMLGIVILIGSWGRIVYEKIWFSTKNSDNPIRSKLIHDYIWYISGLQVKNELFCYGFHAIV